jgi:hypothetical protein
LRAALDRPLKGDPATQHSGRPSFGSRMRRSLQVPGPFDCSSMYGLSAWRPLLWFLGINIAAGLLYSWLAGYGWGAWHPKLLALTLQNAIPSRPRCAGKRRPARTIQIFPGERARHHSLDSGWPEHLERNSAFPDLPRASQHVSDQVTFTASILSGDLSRLWRRLRDCRPPAPSNTAVWPAICRLQL